MTATHRATLRAFLSLLGMALAATRVVLAVRAWRLWRETVVFDPSAAELYQIDFWLHAGAAVSIVGVTLVAWRVLRPRGGA
jgi:hypothetical protein